MDDLGSPRAKRQLTELEGRRSTIKQKAKREKRGGEERG
jgi:hypothetical protein